MEPPPAAQFAWHLLRKLLNWNHSFAYSKRFRYTCLWEIPALSWPMARDLSRFDTTWWSFNLETKRSPEREINGSTHPHWSTCRRPANLLTLYYSSILFISSLTLPCLALPHLILSYLILSYLILSYLMYFVTLFETDLPFHGNYSAVNHLIVTWVVPFYRERK